MGLPDASIGIVDGGGAAAPAGAGAGFQPAPGTILGASQIPVASTGGLIAASDVQGALQEIATNLQSSGGSANPWQGSSGSYNLPTSGGTDVGATRVIISASPPANNAELLRVAAKGRDMSSGVSQNGPGVVGALLGGVTDLANPFICDAGDFLYTIYGLFQKFIPIVINPNYLYVNTAGSPQAITRLVSTYLPHLPLNVVGGGHLSIGEAIGLYMDGDVDPNGNVTITGRRLSIRTGHGICGDQGLWAGDSAASTDGGFVDFDNGTNAAAAAAGHGRILYKPSTGFQLRNEGQTNPQPLVNLSQFFTNFDPSARTYPVGDTVVHSIVPADNGLKNMQTIDPRRWTLPAQIAISGGALTAGIRFNLSNGSTQGPAGLQNGTASPVSVARESLFLSLAGVWITSVDLIVTNTSVSTSSSQDVGNFQFEGVFA